MKKTIFLVIFILTAAISQAGDSYSPRYASVYYDDENRFYYLEINPKVKTGIFSKSEKYSSGASNCLLYKLKSKEKKLIFPKNKNRVITQIIFEKKYDEKRKAIIFNITDTFESRYKNEAFIINNSNLEKRNLSDSILYIVEYSKPENKTGITEIWKSRKDGSGLKKLITLKKNDTWFLDLKNRIICVIQYDYLKTEIKEFQW